MNGNTGQGAGITLYLALTLTIILSLLFCTIESARIASLRVRAKAVTYMAMDSSFSHFALPLCEKYGIFGVFTTEDNFLSLIKDYASKNSNPENLLSNSSFNLTRIRISNIKYTDIYHLTDRDGLIFAGQAIAFETYRAIADKISSLTQMAEQLSGTQLNAPGSIKDDTILVSNDDAALINSSSPSDSTLYKDLSGKAASELKENMVSKVITLLRSNLLLFFIDEPFSISHTEMEDGTRQRLPSSVCILSEEAKAIQSGSITDTLTGVIDKTLFISYIDSCFGFYHSNTNPDISLQYQREYILCGNDSDNDNLLSAALSIVSLRAACNMTYLLSDSEKRGTAFNLGSAISAGIPLLSQFVTFIILSCWAYAESIIDTRDLFQGKKVPFMKSAETWTLSLEGILSLGKNTLSANEGNTGYSYEEYLDMCLFLEDPFSLYYRTMDLIQLDICENYNPNFMMAACVTGANIHATYEAEPLFTNILRLFSPEAYTFDVDMLWGYD